MLSFEGGFCLSGKEQRKGLPTLSVSPENHSETFS